MAKRSARDSASEIPAPTNLQVLDAKPDGVLLQWEHPGGEGISFVLLWCRPLDAQRPRVAETDGQFVPVDEIEADEAQQQPGVFQHRDELPTSGTGQYQVRAFRADPFEESEPSNTVTVTIEGRAAGDV